MTDAGPGARKNLVARKANSTTWHAICGAKEVTSRQTTPITVLPAVLAYNYFLRRLRLNITELENFAHDFMRLALKHNFKA